MSVERLVVRLVVLMTIAGGAIGCGMLPGKAQEITTSHVRDLLRKNHEGRKQPAKSVKDWLAQIEAAIVQVTRVKLEQTEDGLDIVLETAANKPLTIDATKFRREGKSLIADIPNAALALPQGQTFVVDNPTADIATVQVVQLEGNIRVSVAGNSALPKTEVTLKAGGLAYSLNLKEDEADDEIVVTGEGQRGYRVPDASVGTRTDTPLRDIPQSIQVVPQQLLRDQNITRLDDAVRNVPGVSQDFNSGPYFTYRIRGFEALNNNLLRNGQVDAGAGESVELTNVERIEVLKGPASVLFGLGNPGGSINIVTKRPLRDPFYAVDATIGNYDFYRGAIDVSGPANDEKSVLYRLNAAYRNSNSFIDFYNSEYFGISPVISVAIDPKTNLTLEADYIQTQESGFIPFVPVRGSVLRNPIGKIPRNRNVGEPTDVINAFLTRAGYQLNHKFNDAWSFRSGFLFSFRESKDERTFPTSLDADNRTLNRFYRNFDFQSITYTLSNDVVGKFLTGSVQHQLLFGVDLNSYENRIPRFQGATAAPIDLFNPIYGGQPETLGEASSSTTVNRSLGIYLQDQIVFADNFKVLIGGRFDIIRQISETFQPAPATRDTKTESAFSPRLGIVYQPLPPISLYASYVSSFTPANGVFGANLDNDFEPERGRQFEVGVKADLSDRLSTTLAFYDLTRSNVLTEDPDNPGFQIQTGEQNSRGVELSLTGEILPGWSIFTGYAYTDARITEDNTFQPGSQLPNVPYHSFNLWTAYEIQRGDLQGLGFGLGLFYVGDRAGDLDNTYQIPSYFRTDAAIYYRRDRFRVTLNIKNLFDTEYFANASSATRVNYGQPFTIQGTVSWQF